MGWSKCVICISEISQKPQDEDINPLDTAIIIAKSLTGKQPCWN